MKYIVMECNYSYAVVLDEQGRFLNVANRNYKVGQTVTDVIELQYPKSENKKKSNLIYYIATIAACFMIFVSYAYYINQMTYTTIVMKINPEVKIEVNRKNIVVGLIGVNNDGKDLINGYSYKNKNTDLVLDELADMAISKRYLHDGGKISLSFESQDKSWSAQKEYTIANDLKDSLKNKISVIVAIDDYEDDDEFEDNNHKYSDIDYDLYEDDKDDKFTEKDDNNTDNDIEDDEDIDTDEDDNEKQDEKNDMD